MAGSIVIDAPELAVNCFCVFAAPVVTTVGAVILVVNTGESVKLMPPVPVTVPANAVATPVPNPVMPAMGNPVALVNVPEAGVPSTGATNVMPDGNVLLMLGTPPPEVINTPLFAVAKPDTVVPVAA